MPLEGFILLNLVLFNLQLKSILPSEHLHYLVFLPYAFLNPRDIIIGEVSYNTLKTIRIRKLRGYEILLDESQIGDVKELAWILNKLSFIEKLGL